MSRKSFSMIFKSDDDKGDADARRRDLRGTELHLDMLICRSAKNSHTSSQPLVDLSFVSGCLEVAIALQQKYTLSVPSILDVDPVSFGIEMNSRRRTHEKRSWKTRSIENTVTSGNFLPADETEIYTVTVRTGTCGNFYDLGLGRGETETQGGR